MGSRIHDVALRKDEGYSVVEAVLLIPVLVITTLFVVQVALVWHARDLAQAVAQSAVQTARLYGASDTDGARQARDYLRQVDPTLLPGAQIQATRAGTEATVRIRAHVLAVAGIPIRFDIDETATAPLERFVSDHA